MTGENKYTTASIYIKQPIKRWFLLRFLKKLGYEKSSLFFDHEEIICIGRSNKMVTFGRWDFHMLLREDNKHHFSINEFKTHAKKFTSCRLQE